MVKPQSVEQQNAESLTEIQRTVRAFKLPPAWLDSLLDSNGLKAADGLLVKLTDIPEQGGGSWLKGVWLTNSLSFWEFELVASNWRGELKSVEEFKDVTATTAVEPGQPGTGKSFGWLAYEALRIERGT